ncbi:MAG TPA: hypothetical protein ENN28_00215 [Candidatus Uhrbacteria bacterium]|nr:hypothetical protein [Candidatus Uhrbacteria bacterium]
MLSHYAYNKRWRSRYPNLRHKQKKRYYRKHNYSQAANVKRWSEKEEKLILSPKRPGDVELAKQLSRSVQAIQIKRSRLKKQKNLKEGK